MTARASASKFSEAEESEMASAFSSSETEPVQDSKSSMPAASGLRAKRSRGKKIVTHRLLYDARASDRLAHGHHASASCSWALLFATWPIHAHKCIHIMSIHSTHSPNSPSFHSQQHIVAHDFSNFLNFCAETRADTNFGNSCNIPA